jgi:hypothetical protein
MGQTLSGVDKNGCVPPKSTSMRSPEHKKQAPTDATERQSEDTL